MRHELFAGLIFQSEMTWKPVLHDIANKTVAFRELKFLLLSNITLVTEQNDLIRGLQLEGLIETFGMDSKLCALIKYHVHIYIYGGV